MQKLGQEFELTEVHVQCQCLPSGCSSTFLRVPSVPMDSELHLWGIYSCTLLAYGEVFVLILPFAVPFCCGSFQVCKAHRSELRLQWLQANPL